MKTAMASEARYNNENVDIKHHVPEWICLGTNVQESPISHSQIDKKNRHLQ
jgi:hypothetical protein